MRKTYDLVTSKEGFADNYGNTTKVAKVKLTADQIRLLHTTPIVLIPAPSGNKLIHVEDIVAYLDYSTDVFTGANSVEFRETDGSGSRVAADLPYTFLNSASDAIRVVRPQLLPIARVFNEPIIVTVPVADPGGATSTSTLTLVVFYKIVKV